MADPKWNTVAGPGQDAGDHFLSYDQRVYTRPNPTIQRIDHDWFAAHPGVEVYRRPPLPGEFDGRLAPALPGHKWVVEVRAWRDPIDGTVLQRARRPIEVKLSDHN
jgi:hypothetical protein